MAWRSSGTDNNDMVTNLRRFGVIHSDAVEQAFRDVDRRFFVPRSCIPIAHTDQPLREESIHISAPHMYGSVIEALDILPGSSQSFLNLGSGTGYLSCIMAKLIGSAGNHVGVELIQKVVDHCQESIQRWKTEQDDTNVRINIVHGNALLIDTKAGEGRHGFDRIYVGAAMDDDQLRKIIQLLRPGGILVGPVDDDLVKVTRFHSEPYQSTTTNPTPPRSFRGHPPAVPTGFSKQILSTVRFATLLLGSPIPTVIPSAVWDPSRHSDFPPRFRSVCKEILMCSAAPTIQAPPQNVAATINAASLLPRSLWMEILSFAHRSWFEQDVSEEDFLRHRVRQEQLVAESAREALHEAETQLRLAERERDVYRLLAMRWQARLRAESRRNGGESGSDSEVADVAETASAVVAHEPHVFHIQGLGSIFGDMQPESSNSTKNSSTDESAHDMEDASSASAMEEDSNHEPESVVEDSGAAIEPVTSRQVRAVSFAESL